MIKCHYCEYPVGDCLGVCLRWEDGTFKSEGNAFDWKNQDRRNVEALKQHLGYVRRGEINASKQTDRNAGLLDPGNVLFKMNIIAFSRAKGKKT